MPSWISGEILFYGGVVLMVVAAIGFIVSITILGVSRKKLKKQLDEEYGCLKR